MTVSRHLVGSEQDIIGILPPLGEACNVLLNAITKSPERKTTKQAGGSRC